MARIESADRSFRISDTWLNAKANDADAYCDLVEIISGSSSYLSWVVANDGQVEADVRQEAMLQATAIIAYNTASGDAVKCRLAADHRTRTRDLIASVTYPFAVVRVYAKGTTARRIEFLGNGQSNAAARY